MIRGYVDRVEIVCGSERIACHRRSYAREDFVFEPLHYLALLEQKPGALDQAREEPRQLRLDRSAQPSTRRSCWSLLAANIWPGART
jgi:hypothetical protein